MVDLWHMAHRQGFWSRALHRDFRNVSRDLAAKSILCQGSAFHWKLNKYKRKLAAALRGRANATGAGYA